jgi:hypothetical protein
MGADKSAARRIATVFRIVSFALALLLLVAGIIGVHSFITSTFPQQASSQEAKVAGAATTATPVRQVIVATPLPRRKALTPRQKQGRGRAPRKRKASSLGRAIATSVVPQQIAGPASSSAQNAGLQPQVVATPASFNSSRSIPGLAAAVPILKNYWVGASHVHRGQTISFDYVIDNPRNTVVRLWLGASLKPNSEKSWAQAISDPPHDVVATVAPGTTIHLRYFTVPASLHTGIYDLAWGLRDVNTGQRVELVVAHGALIIEP